MPALRFDGPRSKIERAKKHISELRQAISEYRAVAVANYRELERDRWTVDITPDVPISIALVLGDIVHNLRSAFDLLLGDVAEIRGKQLERLAFPFAKDEAQFGIWISKPTKGDVFVQLGEDVVDAISKLKPYRNGNLLFQQIHLLDIQDKHRLVLPISELVITPVDMDRISADFLAGLRAEAGIAIDSLRPRSVTIRPPARTAIRPGEEVRSFPGSSPATWYPIETGEIAIAFGADAEAQGDVLTAVDRFVTFTTSVVEDFARQFS